MSRKIMINKTNIYEIDGDIHIAFNANKLGISKEELICHIKFTEEQKLALEELILNFAARTLVRSEGK
jgi:hypothetical protein